ncbi:MAG: hypothetical protein RMJ19_01825 [Gemmatales bacterium]|nr:hypothetical protein [Gemmatales bacterium]MDW8174384.1 hypothetical protein [Gemmatales bacterium]
MAEAGDLNPRPTTSWRYESGSQGRTYVVVTASWTFRTLVSYPGIPQSVALQRSVRVPVAPAAPQ